MSSITDVSHLSVVERSHGIGKEACTGHVARLGRECVSTRSVDRVACIASREAVGNVDQACLLDLAGGLVRENWAGTLE